MHVLLILFCFNIFAQDFTVTTFDKDLDASVLDKKIQVRHIDKLKEDRKYLSPSERDKILEGVIKNKISKKMNMP